MADNPVDQASEDANEQRAFELARHARCDGCGREIDAEVCWCGDDVKHSHEGHPFVPMGCACHRASAATDWDESDDFRHAPVVTVAETRPGALANVIIAQSQADPEFMRELTELYRRRLLIHPARGTLARIDDERRRVVERETPLAMESEYVIVRLARRWLAASDIPDDAILAAIDKLEEARGVPGEDVGDMVRVAGVLRRLVGSR